MEAVAPSSKIRTCGCIGVLNFNSINELCIIYTSETEAMAARRQRWIFRQTGNAQVIFNETIRLPVRKQCDSFFGCGLDLCVTAVTLFSGSPVIGPMAN